MNSREQSRRVQSATLRRRPVYLALPVLVEPTPLLTRPQPTTTIPYSDYSFKLFLSSFWAILYFMVILHMLRGYAIFSKLDTTHSRFVFSIIRQCLDLPGRCLLNLDAVLPQRKFTMYALPVKIRENREMARAIEQL